MSLDDFKLAQRLQKQYNEEAKKCREGRNDSENTKSLKRGSFSLNTSPKKVSIVDSSLELTDPNPDLHSLFLHFNDVFFWGKLMAVEVKWSSRMTSCAGICCYQGRGGLCSIRLSLPLLKLRPRKDLVETLLHEMIHAYLFVTYNNRDRDGHGPEFHRHMHRINQIAGTKITVYHSFHNEVRSYQQHWWKCQGPCRDRKPHFGMVRRAMNRPPGPSDFWWSEHKVTCGGTFVKIHEPEGFKTARKRHKGIVKGKFESDTPNTTKSLTALSNIKSVPSTSRSGIHKYFSPNKPNDMMLKKKGFEEVNVVSKSPSQNILSLHGSKEIENNPPEDSLPKVHHIPFPRNFSKKKLEHPTNLSKSMRGNLFVPFSGLGRVLGNEEPPQKRAGLEVKCPVCGSVQMETHINEHLDKCITDSAEELWQCPVCGIKLCDEAFDDHLDNCMVKSSPEEIFLSSDDEEESIKPNVENSLCVCPACGKTSNSQLLGQHLEICLSSILIDEE